MPALTAKAQQSAETRSAILSACLKLFAQYGVSSTSIDEIARTAGITKGAVYWHFKSKDDLFQAVLALIAARWQEVVLLPISKKGSPVARLEWLFDGYSELFTEAPEISYFMQRVLLEEQKEFSQQVARVFTQTTRFIGKILEDGQVQGAFRTDMDSSLTAHIILGTIAGVSQQCLADPSLTVKALLHEAKETTLARVRT